MFTATGVFKFCCDSFACVCCAWVCLVDYKAWWQHTTQSISSGAGVAWHWLLIGLLGYSAVASLSHCTYTLCFEQFVIVELWLLIWPFRASLIPTSRDVLRSSCFRLKRGLLLFVILSAYAHFEPYNLRFFRFDDLLTVHTDLRGFCFPCHQIFKYTPSILKPSSQFNPLSACLQLSCGEIHQAIPGIGCTLWG